MTSTYVELGDARTILADIEHNLLDLIVTDPPYASLDAHRAVGTTTRLKEEWFPTIQNTEYPRLFQLMHDVLKPNSHAYVFTDFQTLYPMIQAAEAAGFRVWKPLVWDKVALGMGYHYRCQHEFILFLEKGKRRLASLSVPDVLRVKAVRRQKNDPLKYPTEKPVDLVKILIEQSSSPGDVVLDPFCGSGAVGVAALSTGRRFVGFDVKTRAVELTQARLEALRPRSQEEP